MAQKALMLTKEEIETKLQKLQGWRLKDGHLYRELKFGTFVEAFGFLSSLALVAEKMDHHPEIFNVYGSVNLTLWTHDANGITGLDFELAEAADKLSSGRTQ
jgi:4a-hydroxytetrahydrobiopterin dehydratase